MECNDQDLQEAGDFISKLMEMGMEAIVGITDRVDANNDLVVKRQHQSGSTNKVDNPATLFEKVAKRRFTRTGLQTLRIV